jgi:membrane fusion protein, heavy metal efflux system
MYKPYLFFLATVALSACTQAETEQASTENTNISHHEFIELSEAQFKQAAIETGGFSRQNLQASISAVAELILAKEHKAQVSTLTDGIIQAIKVSTNQFVNKGQVIAVLYKPGLLEIQQEFLSTKTKIPFLKAEYDRYKSLASENATAQRNEQKAAADLSEAETHVSLLAARLKQFNISPDLLRPDQLVTTIEVTAPISGQITEMQLSPGAAVGPGTSICTIGDFSKVNPVVYIYEKDIPAVKTGAKIDLHFLSSPNRHYRATIVSLGGAIDRERKAMPAYARFDEPVKGLVEGTVMEAQIYGSNDQLIDVLPVDAVIREGDGEYIFVMTEQYKFHKVGVRTGNSNGRFVAVTPLESIDHLDKIVIKGAYYVSAQGTELDHDH